MENKKAYLGIDVGSVSVKMALIDEDENIINKVYLKNKGIIETLKEALSLIKKDNYDIAGVGCTGSGRQFTSLLVGGDLVKTEILAHTFSALKYYPNVRTVIDIGGEDNKCIIINDGVMENFVLNNSCSSGTGSFLEGISNRLGIKIEDVGDLALKSENPLNLNTKCGVFLQSSVVNKLNSGMNKSDILMGVINALTHNYISMIKGAELLSPIVYSSATAKNKAIVKSFEDKLKCKIIVPENCEIMGAIGIALLTKKQNNKKTNFKGFECVSKNYKMKIFNADGCENNCEINSIYDSEKYIGSFGNRCEKCIKQLT